ncbi:MAG: valine--tRNA ligase [Patescibacteria group bacterium]|jgi:valyl-tRNA synthetase
MEKNYDHSKEKGIEKAWETAKPKAGYFNPDNLPNLVKRKKVGRFVISMPPPNATGVLHLGHAARITVEDILVRFHRMNGKDTLWVPGTDHAAIATNAKVEQLLAQEGTTRQDIGREAFLKRVERYVEESKGTIRNQIRAMGASCDWSREQFTLSPELSKAVARAFTDMYNAGLIYRGHRVVNWCPHCGSTLADDEVTYRDEQATLYTFRYDKNFPFAIATTRPETKLGDTGVAVNPKDARYKKYIGKTFAISLGGVKREIKVVADRGVDMEYGTGALGVTPAHSQTDEAIAQREGLPFITVIGEDGRMTDAAGAYAGLSARDAREKLVEELRDKKLIKKEESLQHNLSLCYRCNTPIEPLPSKQWFVAVDKPYVKNGKKHPSLKAQALKLVQGDSVQILPERFKKTYFHWMENLHDWNISRQIWYGHAIPVWYKEKKILHMGWDGDIAPEVFRGKTRTYRIRDHKLHKGDIVAFKNSTTEKIFGYAIIEAAIKKTVKSIVLPDVKHGNKYHTTAELLAAFQRLNPNRHVTENTTAWIYDYRFVATLPDEAVEIYVGEKAPKGAGWKKDPDVLDTWFSSALWTFSTLGWPKNTADLKRFHPTTVMETAYDILFFWVARMLLMTSFCLDNKPFETVYLSGLLRDRQNRKMSKSLGNGIDPLAMIERYGADAVRLALALGTTPGQDQQVYEEKIRGYRNFVNKLWNIARYSIPKIAASPKDTLTLNTVPEKALFSRLQEIIETTTTAMDILQFGRAGDMLYEFVWHEFADWYLEIEKFQPNPALLREVLVTSLKLLHPYMPFVTETIWHYLPKELQEPKQLIIAEWPKVKKRDLASENQFASLVKTITVLRRYKKYAGLPESVPLSFVVSSGDSSSDMADILQRLAKLEWRTGSKTKNDRLLEPTNIYGNFGTTIDQSRIQKELENIQRQLDRIAGQLQNKTFVERAPKEIVAELKAKQGQYTQTAEELKSLFS